MTSLNINLNMKAATETILQASSRHGAKAFALVLSFGLGYTFLADRWKVKFSRSRSLGDVDDEIDDKNKVEVALHPNDILIYNFGIPPVTTITWVSGNYEDVIPFLKDRMNAILQKNPWLGGRLVKNSKGKLVLEHFKTVLPDSASSFFVLVDEDDSPVSRSMSLSEMTQKGNSLALSQREKEQPLWKVCVAPCRDSPIERFAIVMSMSHVLGGASTYYSLFSMLTRTDTPIESMDIVRIPNAKDLQNDLFGEEEVNFTTSFKMLFPVIKGTLQALMTRAKVEQRHFVVDNCTMKTIKQGYARSGDAESSRVPFISTNDILVSWFAKHSGCDYVFMNVDTKGKLPQFTIDKAGNYQLPIIYGLNDVTSPSLIRESLMQHQHGGKIQRVVTRGLLPSYRQVLFQVHYGMTTNWTSFYNSVNLPVDKEFREELHLPLVDIQEFMPATFTEMVIFRPSTGKTALRISGHDLGWLEKSKPPFLLEEDHTR